MAPVWPLWKASMWLTGVPKVRGFLAPHPRLTPPISAATQASSTSPQESGLRWRCAVAMTADKHGPSVPRRPRATGTGGAHSGDLDVESVRIPEIDTIPLDMTAEERVQLWGRVADVERELAILAADGESSGAARTGAATGAVAAAAAARADELRDMLRLLKVSDPYVQLREQMEEAVEREEFPRAAKLKLQMDRIGAPPAVGGAGGDDAAAADGGVAAGEQRLTYSTRSATTTHGVRVEVRSQYYPEQSSPARSQYVFIYRVKITNESPKTVQLISRKWEISTAAKGQPMQVVKGPGVVGQQPVLEPGESFEYSSMCPLSLSPPPGVRVLGRMQGCYIMAAGPIGEQMFEAKISPFHMILPTSIAGTAPSEDGSLEAA